MYDLTMLVRVNPCWDVGAKVLRRVRSNLKRKTKVLKKAHELHDELNKSDKCNTNERLLAKKANAVCWPRHQHGYRNRTRHRKRHQGEQAHNASQSPTREQPRKPNKRAIPQAQTATTKASRPSYPSAPRKQGKPSKANQRKQSNQNEEEFAYVLSLLL